MKISRILNAFAGLLFLLAMLLTSIEICSFSRSFYIHEYEKGKQAELISMSDSDLMNATDTLLDYLKDRRDDIVCEAQIAGTVREVYDERETLHMVDVKNLYQNAMTARNIFFAVSVILLLAGWRRSRLEAVKEAYQYGLMMLSVLVIFCLVYALVDFNAFWFQFHYVFFDNDLFILDPNVSIMINMFTETLFFDLVIRIIILFSVSVAVIGAALFFAERYLKHAERSPV